MAVRIVTDSTADIPPELIKEFGLEVVPMSLMFGDEELRDGLDISSEQFFRRLVREQRLPTTSQPPAGVFKTLYERIAADGAEDGILSIHLSSKLSGTLDSARQGAQGVGARISHVDSRQVSAGLGLGVLAAARAAKRGAPLEEVRATAEDVFRRTHLFILFDTLEYLRRGGRMGRGMEVMGTLLKVKPIAKIEEGELVSIARVRTRTKAIEDLLRRVSDLRPLEAAASLHATTPDDAQYLTERLRGLAPDAEVFTARVTPALGVHTGPGAVGVAVVQARPEGTSPPSPTT